jgi:Ca2+-binding EF-hand superfamily protein
MPNAPANLDSREYRSLQCSSDIEIVQHTKERTGFKGWSVATKGDAELAPVGFQARTLKSSKPAKVTHPRYDDREYTGLNKISSQISAFEATSLRNWNMFEGGRRKPKKVIDATLAQKARDTGHSHAGRALAEKSWAKHAERSRHLKAFGYDRDHKPPAKKNFLRYRARPASITPWKRFKKFHFQGRLGWIEFDENHPAARSVWLAGLSQKHLRHLRNMYELVDFDDSGDIDHGEILTIFKQHKSSYSDAMFTIADRDKNGCLDWQEFVHLITTFSAMPIGDMQCLCFKVFDSFKDGDGKVEEGEYARMYAMVSRANGHNGLMMCLPPKEFSKALDLVDGNVDGYIQVREFQKLCDQFPSIIQVGW